MSQELYEQEWRKHETVAFVAWYESQIEAPPVLPEIDPHDPDALAATKELVKIDAYWMRRGEALRGWRGFAVAAYARAEAMGGPSSYHAQMARLIWDFAVHVVDQGEKLADNICLRASDGSPLLTAAIGIGPDAHSLLAALLAIEAGSTRTAESIAAREELLNQWPSVKPKLEQMILRIDEAEECADGEEETKGP